MRTWWGIVFGVLVGLCAAGILWLVSRQPQGEPVRLVPAPTPSPLVVHVTGAVIQPGVYQLPQGARLQDALAAAGGLSQEADVGSINLAALVQDGIQIWVPYRVITSPEAKSAPPVTAGQENNQTPLPPRGEHLINLNTATQSELESLPGIGPVLAQNILAYRQTHGTFKTIEELEAVPGIGPGILAKIRDLVTIDPVP